jgi:hypothetical protein
MRHAPLTLAALILSLAPAMAGSAQPLGTFKSWTAYSAGSGDSKVCYVLALPRRMEPEKTKRSGAYVLVNEWPSRHAVAEPQFVPGYEFKEGGDAAVEIGPDNFDLLTKNEKGAGTAWVKDPNDENRMVQDMKRGAEMVVAGESRRGTKTRDTYSLAGFEDALDKMHEICGS